MYCISMAKYFSDCSRIFASFAGVRKQTTEYGSLASKNSHLAGSSNVAGSQVIQEFCMKEADTYKDDDGDEDVDNSNEDAEKKEIHFMQGKICISCLC